MDKASAQLVTTRWNVIFINSNLLTAEDQISDVWKSFGCQWKEWAAWVCFLLDLSRGVMSF